MTDSKNARQNDTDAQQTKSQPGAAGLDRRDALRLLGAAGLMGVAAPLAGAQTAPAQPAMPTGPMNGNGFYRKKIGEMTVTVVSDGTTPLADVLPTWGANPDRQAQFLAAMTDYGHPVKNSVNNYNPAVIELGGRRVLIDTGRGGTGGQLLANMRRAGLLPSMIDTVFITHGHGDHIGGLTTNGRPTFPRAQHLMGRADFTYWTGQAQPNAAVQANLIALKDRFTLLDDGAQIVPGLTALPTPGHTPGHMSVQAVSGDQKLMLLGDAGGHFLLSLLFPGAYVSFDMNPTQAAATRARVLPMLADQKMWVTAYHFPFPALGHVRRQEGGFEFEPGVWSWTA